MNDEEDIEAYWRDVSPPEIERVEPLPPERPREVFPVVTVGEPEVFVIPLSPQLPTPPVKQRNVPLIRAMHALWVVLNIWMYGGFTSWHDDQLHWAWHPQWAIGQVLVYVTGLVVSAAINSVEG